MPTRLAERISDIVAAALIVARCPQMPQPQGRPPGQLFVAIPFCRIQRPLVVRQGRIVLAQPHEGVAARQQNRHRRRLSQRIGRLQRMIEVTDGGVRRVQRQRLPARPLRIVQRLGPVLAQKGVIGQVGQRRLPGFNGLLLQHPGNDAVHGASLASQQISLRRFLNQRMAEGEAIGALLHQQLGADQLLERADQLGFVQIDQPVQEGKVGPTPCHRGRRQHLPCHGAEFLTTAAHEFLHAARDV